ncbi:MAG: rod shape-determining protein MreD [Elusimicrobiota bacterium]|jgi:rod shape-determining protein MreD
MRPSRVLILFFLALAAEWFWSTYLSVWGVAPQLLLLCTLAVASQSGPVAGQCYGFFWGIFLDVLDVHVFGAAMLILTLTGYVVGGLRRQMDVSGASSQMTVTAGLSLIYWLSLGLAGLVFERQFLWVGWKIFILGTAFNVILAPAVFWVVRRILNPPGRYG